MPSRSRLTPSMPRARTASTSAWLSRAGAPASPTRVGRVAASDCLAVSTTPSPAAWARPTGSVSGRLSYRSQPRPLWTTDRAARTSSAAAAAARRRGPGSAPARRARARSIPPPLLSLRGQTQLAGDVDGEVAAQRHDPHRQPADLGLDLDIARPVEDLRGLAVADVDLAATPPRPGRAHRGVERLLDDDLLAVAGVALHVVEHRRRVGSEGVADVGGEVAVEAARGLNRQRLRGAPRRPLDELVGDLLGVVGQGHLRRLPGGVREGGRAVDLHRLGGAHRLAGEDDHLAEHDVVGGDAGGDPGLVVGGADRLAAELVVEVLGAGLAEY